MSEQWKVEKHPNRLCRIYEEIELLNGEKDEADIVDQLHSDFAEQIVREHNTYGPLLDALEEVRKRLVYLLQERTDTADTDPCTCDDCKVDRELLRKCEAALNPKPDPQEKQESAP